MQSMQLFVKPLLLQQNPQPTALLKRRDRKTTMMMVPSRSSSALGSSSMDLWSNTGDAASIGTATTTTAATTNTIFLNNVPDEISLSYRPVPMWQQVILALGSTAVAAVARSTTSSLPTKGVVTVGKIIKLLLRAFLTALASTAVVQDLFYSPSRVETSVLSQKGWLPSSLSRIAAVQPQPLLLSTDNDGGPAPLAVHYLLYEANFKNTSTTTTTTSTTQGFYNFDTIHFNHGFGASSLSWLPVLPSLVHRLNANVGIAHDAVGFGLTERPAAESLNTYSFDTSAGIGLSLVQNYWNVTTQQQQRLVLIGHSMGALTTLRMAHNLPPHLNVSIVLVSPALITGRPQTKHHSNYKNNKPMVMRKTLEMLQRFFLFTPFQYVLKRIVAYKQAWRFGLQAAWGDPTLIQEDDVLRYRWPSISKGWEKGLTDFARETSVSVADEIQLFADVMERNNTKIFLIHGTKDRIIPFTYSQDLAQVFSGVQLEPMDGLGHNCFEEKPHEFNTLVAKLLT